MSEEWMQCIEACADEAEKLGMKAWIYDENGWPSGFVGGKLLEEEKNRDKYILVKEGVYDANATATYLLTEDELVRVRKEEANEATYLNLYIHTSVSTADILNPDVVKQFLTLTHWAYKERFGEKFSEKIEGFFTDEPQYYRNATPYTDMVAQYWQEQYGDDILDNLGLLFVEKKGYRSFRYRYWKAMQKLMLNSFAKQVYEWCDENDVKHRSLYFDYKREDDNAFGVAKWEIDLFETMGTLAARGVEYHFIDETLFEKYGFVEDKQIGCGKCAYDYLILPSVLTMDISTEKLIRKFVEQGGKILLMGDKPKFLERSM